MRPSPEEPPDRSLSNRFASAPKIVPLLQGKRWITTIYLATVVQRAWQEHGLSGKRSNSMAWLDLGSRMRGTAFEYWWAEIGRIERDSCIPGSRNDGTSCQIEIPRDVAVKRSLISSGRWICLQYHFEILEESISGMQATIPSYLDYEIHPGQWLSTANLTDSASPCIPYTTNSTFSPYRKRF